MAKARFFVAGNDVLTCTLCPRRCRLVDGAYGSCGIRRAARNVARGGTTGGPVLETPYSGYITAMAMDPIEKKPLYHWRPGSSIASVGFFGCNLHCPFCQNWEISQINRKGPNINDWERQSPKKLIAHAKVMFSEYPPVEPESVQIAYTYSEPLVHAEYLLDCMEEARREGLANVLVTNGCVNAEAAEAVLSFCDAANIDLKCFSEKTYSSVLGGNLEAVLDFIRCAVALGVHTEITTLVVPGLNDSQQELTKCAEFIVSLNKDIAWHLSAYHPSWKWNAPPTDPANLLSAAKSARRILPYVYTGNIAGERSDTACPHCGKVLVQRRGYRTTLKGLSQKDGKKKTERYYHCAACGKPSPIRY